MTACFGHDHPSLLAAQRRRSPTTVESGDKSYPPFWHRVREEPNILTATLSHVRLVACGTPFCPKLWLGCNARENDGSSWLNQSDTSDKLARGLPVWASNPAVQIFLCAGLSWALSEPCVWRTSLSHRVMFCSGDAVWSGQHLTSVPSTLQLQFVHVFVRNLPNTFSAATPTDAHLEARNFQLLNEGSRYSERFWRFTEIISKLLERITWEPGSYCKPIFLSDHVEAWVGCGFAQASGDGLWRFSQWTPSPKRDSANRTTYFLQLVMSHHPPYQKSALHIKRDSFSAT